MGPFLKSVRSACFLGLGCAGLATLLTGCMPGGGSGSGGTGGGTTPANYIYMSGNWALTATPAAGSASTTPFPLSGVIFEQAGTSSSHFATSSLQIVDPCYANAPIIPLDGQVNGTQFQVMSFGVENQFLELNAQKDATVTQLTGTYTFTGGCADGRKGTFTGQKYSDFSGTYQGTFAGTPARQVSVAVTQDSNGTGNGNFTLAAKATFTGFSCFNSGQIDLNNNGAVSGSNVLMTFTANDQANAQVSLNGTIDVAAQTLTVNAAEVSGGNCSGALGQVVLTKQ